MEKTVLIISTLDTKDEETYYLRDKIESLGLKPLLMDISMRGEGPTRADITPDRVAEAGGSTIEEIRTSKERSRITNITIAGASRIAGELFSDRKMDGVIGIGGSTGSLMATEVMRSLPFGIPKLMISSTAALPGLSTRYIGTGDIALFHSVIEISGVTDLLKNVMDRAAHAMAGMVQGTITPSRTEKGKAIALTMLGPCEKCASSVRTALEAAGYQVIGFSAAGIGDRAMEEMISHGLFQGVIDLAPGGVGEHLFGFMRDAGPRRMESAGKAEIPQIISTCSVNHMTPAKSKYKPEYHERRKYNLDRFRTWVRLSPDELREVAKAFREKLNRANSPVKVLIPQKGWSSVDYPGNPTFDPEEDRVFVEELRRGLNPDIEILEIDANMEDPEFAKAVVEASLNIL
ncbi:MAG: Tm-1-like ATP-binding domain-containing protein [Proteobacteria bacterium]|nr:Tm-1-like ATP-binding domain-containing protein [Pseudomonadota bacterium]